MDDLVQALLKKRAALLETIQSMDALITQMSGTALPAVAKLNGHATNGHAVNGQFAPQGIAAPKRPSGSHVGPQTQLVLKAATDWVRPKTLLSVLRGKVTKSQVYAACHSLVRGGLMERRGLDGAYEYRAVQGSGAPPTDEGPRALKPPTRIAIASLSRSKVKRRIMDMATDWATSAQLAEVLADEFGANTVAKSLGPMAQDRLLEVRGARGSREYRAVQLKKPLPEHRMKSQIDASLSHRSPEELLTASRTRRLVMVAAKDWLSMQQIIESLRGQAPDSSIRTCATRMVYEGLLEARGGVHSREYRARPPSERAAAAEAAAKAEAEGPPAEDQEAAPQRRNVRQRILEYGTEWMTSPELQKVVQKSRPTNKFKTVLKRMVHEGLIEFRGKPGGFEYRVKR